MVLRWKTKFHALAASLLFGGVTMAADPAPEAKPAEPVAEAAECCEAEEEEEAPSCDYLNRWLLGECFSEKTGITISGWINGGFTINDNASTLHGPLSFGDRQDPLLNQLYLSVGRAVDTEGCKIDFGFKADVLYGSDAVFTQAYGLDTKIISTSDTFSGLYEMAIPQLYAEMFVPVASGLTLKAGHFYTYAGYEVVTAPDNFFYNHAYTMQYGEPFTHTGLMTSLKVNDKVTVHNGVVRGWDNWYDNNNGWSYHGGIIANVTDSTTVSFMTVLGPEQDEPRVPFTGLVGSPNQELDRRFYALVVTQKIGEKLTYVFQHDHGVQDGSGATGAPEAEWYGINQYLLYQLTDKLGLGLRAEWFRDDDGFRVIGVRNLNPGAAANYYELTLGLNYKPNDCIIVRPNVRWDFQRRDSGASAPAFNQPAAGAAGLDDNQFTWGGDIIIKF